MLLYGQVVSSPPGRGIPKTIIKMAQTVSLHGTQCVRVGVWQCSPTFFLKGRVYVVCGSVYGDMYLKDILGSIVRVGYRIPVPDYYLVLHDLRCRLNQTKLNNEIIHFILNLIIVIIMCCLCTVKQKYVQ